MCVFLKEKGMDNIKFVVLTEEQYVRIEQNLSIISEFIMNNESSKSEKDEWITGSEARRLLNVCPKTWQTYRDERRIPFSQFGRKIYVKRSDLNVFMEKNKISIHE